MAPDHRIVSRLLGTCQDVLSLPLLELRAGGVVLDSIANAYIHTVGCVCTNTEGSTMAVVRRKARGARIQRKNYRIDVAKLQRTQRILGTKTETETIHRALDLVAEEAALVRTLRDFVLKGAGHIEDIDAWR